MNGYSTMPCLPPTQPQIDPRPLAVRKIETFSRLGEGWSFGDGLRFEDSVINTAKSLVLHARKHGFLESDAFPGMQGDVLIRIYQGLHCLEFTVRNERCIDYVHEVEDAEIESEDDLTLDASTSKIQELRKDLCESFDFSKPYISTEGGVASQVLPSNRLEKMVVYRSWMKFAYDNWDIQSANTSPSFTRALQAV